MLSNKIAPELLKELEDIISNSTIDTMNQIFGFQVSYNPDSLEYSPELIIASVEFWDVLDSFTVTYIFERELILSLVKNIYDPATITKEGADEICKDTVSELANVISNKIKAFINRHGFNSVMEIPQADILNAISPNEMPHNIHMHFCSGSDKDIKNVIYIGLKDSE